MNPATARQLVVTGMATTTVLVVARAAVGDKPGASPRLPSGRAIAGLGLSFLFLSVLADVAPEVAGPMALLMAVSALVVPYNGQSSATVLLGSLGKVA